jgi:hypothetical protein
MKDFLIVSVMGNLCIYELPLKDGLTEKKIIDNMYATNEGVKSIEIYYTREYATKRIVKD